MAGDVRVLLVEETDVLEIAKLSFEVGKMHDEAMPDYFKPTTQEEHLRIISQMFTDEKVRIFKAVCEGGICGFLCLFISSRPRNGFVNTRTGIILNMGVAEAYRRRGIGAALIAEAEIYLKEQGIFAVELDVFMFNTNAQKLYEKLGFKTIEQHRFKRLAD